LNELLTLNLNYETQAIYRAKSYQPLNSRKGAYLLRT
jgi:hypothetical protein